MLSTCDYLGIHPAEIEKASEVFEAVCAEYSIDSDSLWQDIDKDFALQHGENFGNTVILLLFQHLAYAVEQKGIDQEDIDFYINGWGSHFMVNGEEVM